MAGSLDNAAGDRSGDDDGATSRVRRHEGARMIENDSARLYSAWTDIDVEADGIQIGHIFTSQSTDRSAYQALRTPFMSIRNGGGPATLLMAGHHGDEYEGQVVLTEIASRPDLHTIKGQVFILPRANAPACLAGSRTSPVDGGNLNTAFPGVKGGDATSQIAHFLEETLLPKIDLWIDLHSGGRSLVYEPIAAFHASSDRTLNRQTVEILQAFGAPRNLVFTIQEARAASSAAQRHGVKYIYGEFGGGAESASQEGVRTAMTGVERLLSARHGYRGNAPPAGSPQDQEWCSIDARDFRHTRRYYFFAPQSGIWIAARELGSMVSSGDVVGNIFPSHGPFGPGVQVRSQSEGRLVCLRSGPLVEPGDCVGHLAQPIDFKKVLSTYC
jgi:predicted deacylase